MILGAQHGKILSMGKLRRFLHYFKPHRGLLILDLSCALCVSVVDLAYPLVAQYVLRSLLPGIAADPSLIGTFIWIIAATGFAYILRALFTFIINYWGHKLGALMEADMRRDIFAHMQTLPFSFYDKTRTGKLMSRVTTDLFDITELAHHGPEEVLISGATLFGAFVCMFFVEWRLALTLLCVLPVAVGYVMRIRAKMVDTSRRVKENMADINAGIESSISGARVAKAFTNERYEIEKFSAGNERFVHAKEGFYRQMAFFNSGMEFFMAMFNFVVLAAGGCLIFRNRLDTVALITFTLYVAAFVSPFRKLAAFAENYVLGMAGFTRFLEIMAAKPDINDAPDAVALCRVRGDIRFADVSFAYENDRTVLSHIDLDIPAGKMLALVGPSGGGKTTLCHLLPRFYETRAGTITIDGYDIRSVSIESLRRNVGIVQQDVFLFAGTILDNIRYGRVDASDEEAIAAARLARIHEEIMQLPDGYQTQVGERGIMLSGGQKQRVSIARLFLKNPPVLILDEATSALDTVTELQIQHAFDELSKGRTTLVIAHRLSTVRQANEIVVLDEQGIRERGAHEELLAKNGEYARLYAATMAN